MRAAIKTAPPRLLRKVAARETTRLAAVLGLDGTPGLAAAVAKAERGEPVSVSPTPRWAYTSVLGWTAPVKWQEQPTTRPPNPR
ncbi:hypothetical protein [Actinomadura napierensis]|uniref:Uncharacterized protein n=1 Tax=Actinomadura napierensis TaxID=267854 RepID=A0ABP5L982_9ACTN